MALTNLYTLPVEFIKGALLTSAQFNAMQNNIGYLIRRPHGYALSASTGQTATGATFTQLTNPAVTITPQVSGYVMLFGTLVLVGTTNTVCDIRFDYNGLKSSTFPFIVDTAAYLRQTMFFRIPVTAGVTYTIRLEFNNPSSSGTITAPNGYTAVIFASEVGP